MAKKIVLIFKSQWNPKVPMKHSKPELSSKRITQNQFFATVKGDPARALIPETLRLIIRLKDEE